MSINATRSRQRKFAQLLAEHLATQPQSQRLSLGKPGTNSLAAWFLGPQAENQEVFRRLVNRAIDAHCAARKAFPDPPYVTDARRDESYQEALGRLEVELDTLLKQLGASVPFYSHRYQAHMNWDLTMPGIIGYFAAMLYNQNNVAAEASPVTGLLEREVGDDLCRMLGFTVGVDVSVPAWGHITCDGSVANLEGLWVARNLKYYALSIANALRNDQRLEAARNILVRAGGVNVPLVDLDEWTAVNLPAGEVLDLSARLDNEYKISPDVLTAALDPYLVQSCGLAAFLRQYAPSLELPVVLGTSTKHYSWPKNAAILGIGKNQFINIPIDDNARMDLKELRAQLDACLRNRKPVLAVVVVLGSTEESAVDPLSAVVAMRQEYRRAGLDFLIHVDAAWGGYFASMLREPAQPGIVSETPLDTPVLRMSDYVETQYKAIPDADSVTIDPHKAGYIPYPAGSICYRDKRLRDMVAFAAPEVFHGGEQVDANMGIFGVEGSKPGAAAAAVLLSHQIVRPDRSGYGRILGQALFNSKRFYSAIITMAQPDDPFIVVPVQQIPAEREGQGEKAIRDQLDFIAKRIVAPENDVLSRDEEAMELLQKLGSDQIIITYAFNFKDRNGRPNSDPKLANDFNQAIFDAFSMKPGDVPSTKPLIITTSDFDPVIYGDEFVQGFMRRLGLGDSRPINMHFLSSTTMSPWLTATEKGNFIPNLVGPLREKIQQLALEFRDDSATRK